MIALGGTSGGEVERGAAHRGASRCDPGRRGALNARGSAPRDEARRHRCPLQPARRRRRARQARRRHERGARSGAVQRLRAGHLRLPAEPDLGLDRERLPARARLPAGRHRRPHRPLEHPSLPRPPREGGGACQAVRPRARAADARPRRLQADQRRLRPPPGRRGPAPGRAIARRRVARIRRAVPVGRRGVRDRVAGNRHHGRTRRRRACTGADRGTGRGASRSARARSTVTASVGVATTRGGSEEVDALIAAADAALYRAKAAGKNRVEAAVEVSTPSRRFSR